MLWLEIFSHIFSWWAVSGLTLLPAFSPSKNKLNRKDFWLPFKQNVDLTDKAHLFVWIGELMGLTHKLLDGMDIRNYVNWLPQWFSFRFYSGNLMNTLCHMIFQFIISSLPLKIRGISCFQNWTKTGFMKKTA